MKKMNGRVLEMEAGTPAGTGDLLPRGWMQETMRALRQWERRNGVSSAPFMSRFGKGKKAQRKPSGCPAPSF